MSNNVNLNGRFQSSQNIPLNITESHPSISFCDNLSIAIKRAWHIITTPKNLPRTILKATTAIPLAIVLVAITLTLLCFGILYHAIAFPFVMTARKWSIPAIKDYIGSSIKELKAFALSIITFPLDGTQFDPTSMPPGKKAAKTPVLLIHGFLHSSSAWNYMRTRLEKAGIPVYTINLGSPFNSISKDYIEKVREKALQIAKETGRNDLFLIGHSMGGIVSSEYATTLAPSGTITGVVTLGSPLHGTKMAKIVSKTCAKEMQKQDPFIIKLGEKIQKSIEIQFFNFSSKTDLIVPPTITKLTAKHIITHEFKSCGHMTYLYSSTVADIILLCYHSVVANVKPKITDENR